MSIEKELEKIEKYLNPYTKLSSNELTLEERNQVYLFSLVKKYREEIEIFVYHGCLTGDCPHEKSIECHHALIDTGNKLTTVLEWNPEGK